MELDVLAIYESFGELHSDRSLTASDRPKSLVKKGGNAETWNADLACDKPLENYASGAGCSKIIVKIYGKYIKI